MSYKSFISFLCLFVSATFLYATDLQVVTVTPKGENAPGGRSPVSVTFNQPVAALGESSAFSSENCPLIISPEVKGTCRFVGTQTLQFEPEGNWPPATQYTALLPGTFTSKVSEEKLGKDYQWTFTTKRPQIEQVIPSNGEQWIDVRPLIYVTLSQPVDLVSAQEATQVSYRVLEKETPTWWEQFKSALLRKPVKHSKGVVSVPVKVRGVTDTEYREHYSYLDKKFQEAMKNNPMHEENLKKIEEMDDYVIQHFRIAFGNRIVAHMRKFVPVFVACGGDEVAGIDYFIARKILRKFEQLNIAYIRDEIDGFVKFLNDKFGEGKMAECIEYLLRLKKMA